MTPEPIVNPEPARAGFVYMLINRSMPGRVKVGTTSRHPGIRAAELSASTGIPEPFRVAAYWDVPDRYAAEATVHSALGLGMVAKRPGGLDSDERRAGNPGV